MRTPLELINKKFGRLTVVSKNSINSPSNNSRWDCVCDCGNKTTVIGSKLINGHTSSCGCFHIEQIREASKTHGKRSSNEYSIWCGLKSRCLNENGQVFDRYGGRGITVCEDWRGSFEAFHKDMGTRPSSEHSIERLDNNKGYGPDNCVWATPIEQANNRRSNSHFDHDGQIKTIAEWARQYNVPHSKFNKRLKLGWAFDKAVFTP